MYEIIKTKITQKTKTINFKRQNFRQKITQKTKTINFKRQNFRHC